MTPAMLEKARQNATKAGLGNVEFRLGEIEHLPVADASVDVIISNCVITCRPTSLQFSMRRSVFLNRGVVWLSPTSSPSSLSQTRLQKSVAAYACCISGAPEIKSLEVMLGSSGFSDIRITINEQSHEFIRDWLPDSGAEEYVASATIQASKNR